MIELPLYQCHKKVRAAKINRIRAIDSNGATMLILDGVNGDWSVPVNAGWLKRNPAVSVGGYFVQYHDSDNYTAYSPAGPFENGYTRIEG
jgi:hypothetical protein